MGLTKKVMVLFDPESYKLVEEQARQMKISIGQFIRDAVDRALAEESKPDKTARMQAARRLTAAKEAVIEWDELERVLERGHRT
ncbi:MAG TPA: hypothetical protein EYP63_01480 [Desulfotomaculum sp.]|nr:hypothetical protein [Desulfotomaculum sp.]